IIFMTDGAPNLPAPPNYHNYSYYHPYNKCIDPVHNAVATTYRNEACTYDSWRRRWTCPRLPSSKIKDYMISSSVVSCGETYTDYMSNEVKALVDEAKQHDITIHTISIWDKNVDSNSMEILRRLIKDPDWDPGLLEYMTATTKGESHEAKNYE